jgi:hypothetical protein
LLVGNHVFLPFEEKCFTRQGHAKASLEYPIMYASLLALTCQCFSPDLQEAGPAVIIPLYSTVLPFQAEIKNQLPSATFLLRPDQNFEGDITQLNAVFNEFLDGGTTALLAAKGDIAAVLPRANLTRPFPLDDIITAQTNVILPVGAFLPLPGPQSLLSSDLGPGDKCFASSLCKSGMCIAKEDGGRGGQCL